MIPTLTLAMLILERRGQAGGGSGPGCFLVLLAVGLILYFVFRGRRDRQETPGAARRPLDSGPQASHTFACPFPKCPNCGAAADKMRQQWDGMRRVTWSCGYCGHVQVQELRDEELPASARQNLGQGGGQGMMPGPGYPQGGGMGSGLGGLMTGMMLGSMLGGGSHDRHDDGSGWGGGSSGGGGDWDGGGSGDSGGSGDWDSGGDSGGGDFGGGDSGGGDW
jgi:hypothetical protein